MIATEKKTIKISQNLRDILPTLSLMMQGIGHWTAANVAFKKIYAMQKGRTTGSLCHT